MHRLMSSVVFALVIAGQTASAATPRTWMSSDRKFQVEAMLAGFGDESVKLVKASGKSISVPLAKLSRADRKLIARIRKTQFAIDGVGLIATPSTKHKWTLERQLVVSGESLALYGCRKAGSTGVLTMTVTSQVAHEDAARAAVVNAGWNAIVDAREKRGHKHLRGEVPDLSNQVPDVVVLKATYQEPSGVKTAVNAAYVFHENAIITYTAFADTSAEALELLSVSETLILEE